MKRNYIIGIIVILILIIVGFIFLKNNNFKNDPESSVATFLNLIKKETEINFSNPKKTSLNWLVNAEDGNIIPVAKEAEGMSAKNITFEEQGKIDRFFTDNGFEIDLYNVADGPEGSISGYRKNKMYCIVRSDYILGQDNDVKTINENINCAL